MRSFPISIAWAAWVLFLGTPSLADAPLEIISNGKKATALVVLEGKGIGTAFCVHSAGYFITNSHVVTESKGRTISLVLEPGEVGQRVLTANVISSDSDHDLALIGLAQKTTTPLASLQLGDDSGLIETSELTAFGYPFGSLLAEKGTEYPSVSVSRGRITSLRKSKGQLQRIQLDASLNPGNSGGPVLDANGKVVAVVVSGIMGSGVNFAIPISHLRQLTEKPQVMFDPPTIAADSLAKETEFSVNVVSLGSKKHRYAVQLSLTQGDAPARVFSASTTNGELFKVRAAPRPATMESRVVRLNIKYSAGSVTGDTKTQTIRLGAKSFELAELRQITPGTPSSITAADGSTSEGALEGLKAVPIDVGGASIVLDLTKAKSIEVENKDRAGDRTNYAVSVSEDGKVVAELLGSLPTNNPAGMAKNISLPAIAPGTVKDELTINLPAPVDDVALGGHGRFLVAHLKKVNKLAIIDLPSAKIVQYLAVPDTSLLFAAGEEKLIVVLVNQKTIQRYSLQTLARELTVQSPFDGVIKAIAMGSGSNGPILVHWAEATAELSRASWDFIDLDTLAKMNLGAGGRVRANNTSFRDFAHIRASADGTVFGIWCTSHSPSGLETMVLRGKQVETFYNHTSAGHVTPGPDGEFVFTGIGIYTSALRRIVGEEFREASFAYLPAQQLRYYLKVPATRTEVGRQARKAPVGSVYLLGNDRPLVNLPELPEMAAAQGEAWTRSDFTFDKRVVFLPQANILATIPFSNDRIVVRPFNLVAALEASGIDYLFVDSAPPLTAEKGSAYSYKLTVRSKRGGIRYKLDSGPEGMTLSPQGVLKWQVPSTAGNEAAVIINIKDNSGQEIFHTFNIALRQGE